MREQYEKTSGVDLDGDEGDHSARPALDRSISKPLQNVDDLYNKLGDPGRLQTLWFAVLAFHFISVSSNSVVGVFFGFTPGHFCNASVDGLVDANSNLTNSLGQRLNWGRADLQVTDPTNHKNDTTARLPSFKNSQPFEGYHTWLNQSGNNTKWAGLVQRSECSVNVTWPVTTSGYTLTDGCQRGEWVYDLSGRESTTVSDFDLVCEDNYLTYLASTLYYVGFMLANFTHGYASDRFGRRPVVLASFYLLVVVALGISFANNFYIFAALRLLMGILTQGIQSASFVLAIELFPVHHRSFAGSTIQVFWGVGCLYLSLVAWVAKDWRLIQLGLIIPSVISAVGMWFVGESVRWLLAKGKTKPVSKVVERIATFNKVENPIRGDDHSVLAEYKVHYVQSNSSYLALVRTPQMRKRIVFMSIVVFGVNAGYFGMTYNNAELAGDRYLNFFLGSLTETIAYAGGSCCVIRYGRRRPLMVGLLLSSVCCLVSGVIPNTSDTHIILINIFSVIGRFAVAACYCAAEPFTAELLPTVLRSRGVGVCTFMGRLGAALAPLISALRYAAFAQLPPLIFATFAFLGALAVLLLPETSGQHLPDTVEDVESNFGWKSEKQRKSLIVEPDRSNNGKQLETGT